MAKHEQVHHEDGNTEQFTYKKCDSFSVKKSLDRHNREKHYKSKANFDYVEDLDSLQVFKCEHCEHQFKRKSDLKRHHARAHEEKDARKVFKCLECDKSFSRRDDVNRHAKKLHKKK